MGSEGKGENGNLFMVKPFPEGVKGWGNEKTNRAHQCKSLWESMSVCVSEIERERERARERESERERERVCRCAI